MQMKLQTADATAKTPAPATTPKLAAFWRAWLRKPLGVGAIAPSSRALAELICSEINASRAPVLELGPGTGVFTQALLDRGVRPADLYLVEAAEEFIALLNHRFPGVAIAHASAAELAEIHHLKARRFDAAISGLPLRAMAPEIIDAIIGATFAHLRPSAALYQFTYGWRNPVPEAIMQKYKLRAICLGRVWANIPPAAVYRIERVT